MNNCSARPLSWPATCHLPVRQDAASPPGGHHNRALAVRISRTCSPPSTPWDAERVTDGRICVGELKRRLRSLSDEAPDSSTTSAAQPGIFRWSMGLSCRRKRQLVAEVPPAAFISV